LSTSQSSNTNINVDTPVPLASFLADFVQGKYIHVIDLGTTSAGTRFIAEIPQFKKGKPLLDKKGTQVTKPVSLLVPDLTTKNVQITSGSVSTVLQSEIFLDQLGSATLKISGPYNELTNIWILKSAIIITDSTAVTRQLLLNTYPISSQTVGPSLTADLLDREIAFNGNQSFTIENGTSSDRVNATAIRVL
jgi:hypothetical protein